MMAMPSHPLARAEHVLLGQSAVVAQHVLDDRVDAALQPVRGARHRPTCGKRRPGKGEELFPSRNSFSNRRQQRRSSSCVHHWKARTSPLSPSMAMIRHQPWPMYVPSAMTYPMQVGC